MAFNEKLNPLRLSNDLQSRPAHQTPEYAAKYGNSRTRLPGEKNVSPDRRVSKLFLFNF